MSREQAVAQAHANVSRPISVDPQVEECDRIAAQKFLAMLDAATGYERGVPTKTDWDRELDAWVDDIMGGEA